MLVQYITGTFIAACSRDLQTSDRCEAERYLSGCQGMGALPLPGLPRGATLEVEAAGALSAELDLAALVLLRMTFLYS